MKGYDEWLKENLQVNVYERPDFKTTFEKYVIQRMKDTIPGNTIKGGHKTRTPREW